MNPYAQQDAAYERRIEESEEIFSIYEELMGDRDVVRDAIVEVRYRNPTAAKGGEFSGLVEDWIMELAESQLESRSKKTALGMYFDEWEV